MGRLAYPAGVRRVLSSDAVDGNVAKGVDPWLIDRIFDRALGWAVPVDAAPVVRGVAPDGNPTYTVTVGEINVIVWEIRGGDGGGVRDVSAGRLAARVEFLGITIRDPAALLTDSYRWTGLPSCGLNEAGQPTLRAAFPVSPSFPVDLARRQLMVCICTLVMQAQLLLDTWRRNSGAPPRIPAPASTNGVPDWSRATGIAAVVGAFLGAHAGFS
jgi:hypothetical protein